MSKKYSVFISVLFCLFIFGFGIAQFIVSDAFLDEFQPGLHRHKVHQIAILNRLGQFVTIGRHTVFQFKDLIGVLVDLVLGGSGQANQRRIEIVEDIPVLVVDRPVGLVTDHQIKMAAGEELAMLVLHIVDAVHHGLIGGEHAVGGIVVLLFAEVRAGKIGQEIDKAAFSACPELPAVTEFLRRKEAEAKDAEYLRSRRPVWRRQGRCLNCSPSRGGMWHRDGE